MKAQALKTELPNGESVFSKSNCDAVLFDLDGVITTTEKSSLGLLEKDI